MNFKKIILYPLRILKKIFYFLKIEFNELQNPTSKRYIKLLETYKLCDLEKDRDHYVDRLNNILKSLGFKTYNENEGMYSEHLILFSALSVCNENIKNILEIGTHNGMTACVLSLLFPSAKIITIDLKDNDPIFKNTYGRKNNFQLFIKERNKLISRYSNINFVQLNSLELTNKRIFDKQDLIWVDGAHGYPIVTSDITNAIGLMHKKSILMCDDIWKNSKKNDKMYQSNAGFETLNSFSNAKIIKNFYFRKRIGKFFNGNYKYISFSKLT